MLFPPALPTGEDAERVIQDAFRELGSVVTPALSSEASKAMRDYLTQLPENLPDGWTRPDGCEQS